MSSSTSFDEDEYFVLSPFGSDDTPDQQQDVNVDVSPTIVYPSATQAPNASSVNQRSPNASGATTHATEEQGPIFRVRPMDTREGHTPFDEEALENECVYVRNGEAKFQMNVDWPGNYDCHWVKIQSHDSFGVSFQFQDDNCQYQSAANGDDFDGFMPNQFVSGIEFCVSVTCSSGSVNHVLRLCDEDLSHFSSIEIRSP